MKRSPTRRAGPQLLAILLAFAGCQESSDPPPSVQPADSPDAATPAIEVQLPDSGTFIDFQWANASTDQDTLRARLEAFVDAHGPVDGAFEDAVHLRFYRVAQFRLARSYYHAGRLADGDRVLQNLEETDASIR